MHQSLSESFIEKHKDKIIMLDILRYQKISEDFIIKYIDDVSSTGWTYISQYQILSESFIKKYKEYLNITYILKYQNISVDLKKELSKEL